MLNNLLWRFMLLEYFITSIQINVFNKFCSLFFQVHDLCIFYPLCNAEVIILLQLLQIKWNGKFELNWQYSRKTQYTKLQKNVLQYACSKLLDEEIKCFSEISLTWFWPIQEHSDSILLFSNVLLRCQFYLMHYIPKYYPSTS